MKCAMSTPVPAALEGLIDIGANLSHESFAHDLDAVLERARGAGVAAIVVTGASEQGSRDALALAAAHPGYLYATAGLHPHHASDFTAETDALFRALLADPRVLAVGETGLDYYRDLSPRDAQIFENLGTLYLARGNLLAARDAFTTALQLDPQRTLSRRALTAIAERTP